MDAQIQAIRADLLQFFTPMLENQRNQLQWIDQNRITAQTNLHQEIQRLRVIVERNAPFTGYQRQLEADINRLDQNQREQQRKMGVELNNLRGRLYPEGTTRDIQNLRRKSEEQQQIVQELMAKVQRIEMKKCDCPCKRSPRIMHEKQIVKAERLESAMIKPKLAQQLEKGSLVSPFSKNIGQYIIGNDGVIEKRADGWFQILGSISIADKPVNQFTIKRTRDKFLCFGMIDARYINDVSSWKSQRKQSIGYDALNGGVGMSGKWEGNEGNKGLFQGETLIMQKGGQTISWRVGQQIRARYTNPMLGDASINWVPLIIMHDKGDIIQWK